MEAPAIQQRLVDEARGLFAEVANPKAPGLQAMVERAAFYARVDWGQKEILLNMRAILLACVEVGLRPMTGPGTASGWLVEWLAPHIPNLDRRLYSARTNDKDLYDALSNGCRVALSRSVRGKVLPRAQNLSVATVKRQAVDLRHVLIACLDACVSDPPTWEDLGWRPMDPDYEAFRRLFLSKLQAGRERGESLTAWRTELKLEDGEAPPPPPPPPPPPEAPPANLSGFTADRPDGDSRADPLAVRKDVEAFARLIAFSGTDTPLSIGVFGSWGSGKSTFMERLEDEIAAIAETAGPPREGPRMLGRIVQVRFNAWHFADANLWASLTAEFFDQLRSGGYDKQGEAIHARLVERVNAHVHDLSTAAGQTRQAVSAGEQKLAQAQKARDEAVGAASADMSQKLLDALGRTYEANKAKISAISGQAGASDDLDLLIHAAQNAPKLWGKVRVIGKAAAKKPVRTATILAAMVAVVVAVFVPEVLGLKDTDLDWSASILASLAAAAGALTAVALPGVQLINMVISGTAGVEKELQAARTDQLKTVLAAEASLKAAADEAAARREASDRASQALSRYIDPTSQGNPPRLLRYMLDDDPDTRALEKEIGLMGRARRLFEAVDKIVEEERKKGDKADPQTPERIVLYIDDLDRCTYEQVYAVLQAVHLLLAFKLFVVVVAVDVNWVTEALAHQAGRRMDATAEGEAAALKNSRIRAVAYLEKIFQLPFWIRPMGGPVYGEFVRGLLKGREEAEEPVQPPVAETAPDQSDAPPSSATDKPETGETSARTEAVDPATVRKDEAPAAPPRDDLRTLAFSEAEAGFLASPELAAIAATTPRGVLRMINIYRIVRLTTPAPEAGAKPLWPLIAVFAAVETGCESDVADALYAELRVLESDYAVDPNFGLKATARAINTVVANQRGLPAALAAAATLRGEKTLPAGDCLAALRAVRRYSFNRY